MLLGGTPQWYESLAEDASLLNPHVAEGVGDVVQDANQLGQHPLLCYCLQCPAQPLPITEQPVRTSLLASLALMLWPQHAAA